jgi:hypothetical protein
MPIPTKHKPVTTGFFSYTIYEGLLKKLCQ